jgi:hypothetical protein
MLSKHVNWRPGDSSVKLLLKVGVPILSSKFNGSMRCKTTVKAINAKF